MNRLSSVALSAALVVAGVGASVSAESHPCASPDVGYAPGVVLEPVGYARPHFAPYYYPHRYWHHDFGRYGYDRFHHERWYRR